MSALVGAKRTTIFLSEIQSKDTTQSVTLQPSNKRLDFFQMYQRSSRTKERTAQSLITPIAALLSFLFGCSKHLLQTFLLVCDW
mmetsp:Transcript_16468/g.24368  ORF Transcript_16468/g.24368 Transcript_16468/m.24368 type:complete len:84 (-) Transcript_16468:733-984(-)